MRSALPLILTAAVLLPFGLQAQNHPTHVDPSLRNESLAPTPESTDNRLSPQRPANQRPFFRNDTVQDQRFNAPENIERKDAAVGDKRAAIDITETREKVIIDRKDYPKPEVRERELNRHDGEKSNIQPQGDMIKSYDKVAKYQDRMADAKNSPYKRQTTLEKRTTFEKLNRFIFQRNGPGSGDGQPVVTPAAGGPAPTGLDTYQRYEVDWSRLNTQR
jgi:hypothetical protein